MATVEFTRWFLASYFTCVAAFYTVRIVAAKRRQGRSPVFAGRPGTLHYVTHTTFRVFRVVILGVCVVRVGWPGLDRYLWPFAPLWHPIVLAAGDLLLLAGFTGALYVHFYMGADWRSGTRADDRNVLITTGPFARSRNPMMLGVIAAQVGLFLALPSVFTLVCLIVGVWAVVAQVRVEERILSARFGRVYADYAARTPRWLGRARQQGATNEPPPGLAGPSDPENDDPGRR